MTTPTPAAATFHDRPASPTVSYGWAGWIHWETSGAHFYSWERPVEFFSVDIYVCKAFDPAAVLAFTEEYFRTSAIVARQF